jgi:NTP pyrophosphatase (non-canonical NTP hydrolase)
MTLSINDYQEGCKKTEIYGKAITDLLNSPYSRETMEAYLRISYCVKKLNGEAGEIAEEAGKALRDDRGLYTHERQKRIRKEIGDVCWYVSQLCSEFGFKLEEIMQENLDKLLSRQERGVLKGSGSNR